MKNFNEYLKEQTEYEKYTKELSEKDFIDIYKDKCFKYDLKNPFLLRQIKNDAPFLYIDTKQHRTKLHRLFLYLHNYS